MAEITDPHTLDPQILSSASPELQALLAAQGTMIEMQRTQIADLTRRLEWFQRQVFGEKSERLALLTDAKQLCLSELPLPEKEAAEKSRLIRAHTRREVRRDVVGEAESVPFFDETRVPIETIVLEDPAVEGLAPEQLEVIGEKVSYRLAQRPGSYVVLKYVRRVIKRRDSEVICCPAAPLGVIEGSRADVSFIAGLIVDKMAYHLPLYRQHQRLMDAGIEVTRPWLTQLVQQGSGSSSRSMPRSSSPFGQVGSRPWMRPRSRPAAPGMAR